MNIQWSDIDTHVDIVITRYSIHVREFARDVPFMFIFKARSVYAVVCVFPIHFGVCVFLIHVFVVFVINFEVSDILKILSFVCPHEY